jgi:hypothetical protein
VASDRHAGRVGEVAAAADAGDGERLDDDRAAVRHDLPRRLVQLNWRKLAVGVGPGGEEME